MTTDKPSWAANNYGCTEAEARWLLAGNIVKIRQAWEMTSADTSRDWIQLTRSDGSTKSFHSGFFTGAGPFAFSPNGVTLIQLRRYSTVRETLKAIDEWNAANERDRQEYERLKRKFES